MRSTGQLFRLCLLQSGVTNRKQVCTVRFPTSECGSLLTPRLELERREAKRLAKKLKREAS